MGYLMNNFSELLEEVEKHLDSTHQNWLFGAGISFDSNIPLMYPMTEKIEKDLVEKSKETYQNLKKFLPEDAHIEHYLSHIGDLLALIERSAKESVTLNDVTYTRQELVSLYHDIVTKIGDLVRFGYDASNGNTGSINQPIISIEYHLEFVKNLFNRRSNLENISSINFFTTNYDTLLEDALNINRKYVIDGFTGGAMGFWNPSEFKKNYQSSTYKVIKLHGSIDWHKDDGNGLVRCRYGTNYLSNNSNLLIYPQATKYLETQKDPFAFLFNIFRENLSIDNDKNVLIACGYSFGDNHINQEIELALSLPNNKTTLIIFIKENDNAKQGLPQILNDWLCSSVFSERMYVLTQKGIYNAGTEVQKDGSKDQDWWTFKGLTKFLE